MQSNFGRTALGHSVGVLLVAGALMLPGVVNAEPPTPSAAPGPSSANMSFHGGRVLPTTVVKAIFWGTSWADGPRSR